MDNDRAHRLHDTSEHNGDEETKTEYKNTKLKNGVDYDIEYVVNEPDQDNVTLSNETNQVDNNNESSNDEILNNNVTKDRYDDNYDGDESDCNEKSKRFSDTSGISSNGATVHPFDENLNRSDDRSSSEDSSRASSNEITDDVIGSVNTSLDDSLETDEEEILRKTKFTDDVVPVRRPSRPRRSGVVNDSNFIERLLSNSSTNSVEDLSSVGIEDIQNEIIASQDDQNDITSNAYDKDDGIENGDIQDEVNQPSFFIGNNSKENSDEDLKAKDDKEEKVDNNLPSYNDIYYEEGPKRLKRNTLEKEDFSGAKTYHNKDKLIVKYPNRKVSFEHRLVHTPDHHGDPGISPLAIDVGSASPKTILKSPKRKVSFESSVYRHSQPATGHINYAYMHDEFKDKLEKRKVSLETSHFYAQESEMYNDNDTSVDIESPTSNGADSPKRNNSADYFPNGHCKRSPSTESFNQEHERYVSKRPSLLLDDDEYDLINKNFSAHLRKDSIALTSEKLRQMESLQRHYSPRNIVDVPGRKIWKEKLSNLNKYQLHICVLCIFIALVSIVVVGWHFHNRTSKMEKLGKRIFFDEETKEVYLTNPGDSQRMYGTLGVNVPSWQLPFHCHTEAEKSTYTCLRWKDNAILRISYFQVPDVNCYNISWEQLRHDLLPFDCFDIGDEYWYGPSNQSSASWPLTSEPFVFSAAMSRHFDAGTFSSAIDYHWISSAGAAIFVPNEVPLEVDWNIREGKVCLIAKYEGDFYGGHTLQNARLNYTICSGEDPVTTFKYTRKLMTKFPKTLPSYESLNKPVWSFNISDPAKLTTENDLIETLHDIKNKNFSCSIFEIAGQWQNRLGDLTFSSTTFTNTSLVMDLTSENGCSLSVEMNPYFDVRSANFKEGVKQEYFVKDSGSFAPAVVKLGHEITAMLDVSKESAKFWMSQKLNELQNQVNVQSFSIVYGKPYWVPYNPSFSSSNLNPSTLRELFTEMFSRAITDTNMEIIQGTSNSQDVAHFLPVQSIIRTKEGKSCLSGAIERTLALGIKGYPFVISDLLAEETPKGKSLPSRELYIRWLQLSSFLPAIRFNIMPWKYDSIVVEIAQNVTKLHEKYITPTIYKMSEEILEGEPIIRPVWWVHPNDEEAFKISDEFLVGDNILVAPVLCEHTRERRIYFPEGMWNDKSNGNLIQGKNWIQYPVHETKIPFFVRVKVLTTNGDV